MKILPFIFFYILVGVLAGNAISQEKYWVFFKDKDGVEFNPHRYFDQKTIERRRKQGISINQFTDRPVKEIYIEQVRQAGSDILSVSRWLNAIMVSVKDDDIVDILNYKFVKKMEKVREREVHLNYDTVLTSDHQDLLNRQLSRFDYKHFKAKGVDGRGVRIAVFDAGFPGVNTNPFFSHLFENNQIKATYDFIQDEEDVFGHTSHGTMVLSCISGKYGDRQLGLATGAEFLLARTEYGLLEPFSEEQNWFEAMEWADKNGADIISSSLGYTFKRYFKQNMDGQTSLVSKAASIAASKGILVVISMGNEGQSRWKVLSTPADADSILSIGGLDPNTGLHVGFSSYGPTADMRTKPNLTAFGKAMVTGRNTLIPAQGTSFSAPLVAGFAACVWQMHPKWSNMKLINELTKAGDLYPYYDYAHGYGVPQASYFTDSNEKPPIINADFDVKDQKVIVHFNKIDKIHSNYFPFFFYHIANEKGILKEYAVLKPTDGYQFEIPFKKKYSGCKLKIHFAGNTAEFKIP